MTRPKNSVLVLAHEPPLPAISGGRVRDWNLLRQLHARGWEVSLFALTSEEIAERDLATLRQVCANVEIHPLAHRSAVNRLKLALGVLGRRAFQRTYFFSRSARAALESFAGGAAFDVVLASQLYMYPYLSELWLPRSVLDCHNSELRRVEGMAASLGPTPRGLAARLQIGPVRRYEAEAARAVARILAVSRDEAEYFQTLTSRPVTVIPNGVDCAELRPRDATPESTELLYVGSLDYSANSDGLRFLINDILPRLRGGARLTVVGGGASQDLLELGRRAAIPVAFAGRVPDTRPYFASARLMVAPLRFGGGTRLKILESLARGVPVVTTSVGCEGLGIEDGNQALVADDADAFAAAVDRLLAETALCDELARAARVMAEARFDWPRIGADLDRALRDGTGGRVPDVSPPPGAAR